MSRQKFTPMLDGAGNMTAAKWTAIGVIGASFIGGMFALMTEVVSSSYRLAPAAQTLVDAEARTKMTLETLSNEGVSISEETAMFIRCRNIERLNMPAWIKRYVPMTNNRKENTKILCTNKAYDRVLGVRVDKVPVMNGDLFALRRPDIPEEKRRLMVASYLKNDITAMRSDLPILGFIEKVSPIAISPNTIEVVVYKGATGDLIYGGIPELASSIPIYKDGKLIYMSKGYDPHKKL